MAFDKDNPVVVGEPTKADDYNVVHDNDLFFYQKLLDQVPTDNATTTGHTHTGPGDGAQIPTGGVADNAITEAKIADTDLPEGFRAYAATQSGGAISTWTEDFDAGNFSAGTYTIPSNGVYALFFQVKADITASGTMIKVQIKNGATILAESYGYSSTDAGNTYITAKCSTIEDLTASDSITVAIVLVGAGTPTIVTNHESTYFYGYKLPWTTSY